MKTTTHPMFSGDVVIVEGAVVLHGNGKHQPLYGVFASIEDALSEEADELCLGTLGPDALTPEQIETASANAEAI